MDPSANPLQAVLVLLASSVLAVALCRSLRLPPMVGYLVTGLALGPHALRRPRRVRGTTPPLATAARLGACSLPDPPV